MRYIKGSKNSNMNKTGREGNKRRVLGLNRNKGNKIIIDKLSKSF